MIREELPPPRPAGALCRKPDCRHRPEHVPGLCALAQVVVDHTRRMEIGPASRERRRASMVKNRRARWEPILRLVPPT